MNGNHEVGFCRKMLVEMADMCEDATMNGSLAGGNRRTAQRYNSILKRLVSEGRVPSELFEPLPDDAAYADIGVEAKMLASYLPKEKGGESESRDPDKSLIIRLAPFLRREDLDMLVRDQLSKGAGMDLNMLAMLGPFMGQEMLGQLVRNQLKKQEAEAPSAPRGPDVPTPPVTPTPPHFDRTPERINHAPKGVEEILALLKSPYLADEERESLVEELRTAMGH